MMSDGSEFPVCGAAVESVRHANSVSSRSGKRTARHRMTAEAERRRNVYLCLCSQS